MLSDDKRNHGKIRRERTGKQIMQIILRIGSIIAILLLLSPIIVGIWFMFYLFIGILFAGYYQQIGVNAAPVSAIIAAFLTVGLFYWAVQHQKKKGKPGLPWK